MKKIYLSLSICCLVFINTFAQCPSTKIVTVNSVTIISGNSATLTANGASFYYWSTGQTTNPISVTPGLTTSYTVTDANSSCPTSAIAKVTVQPQAFTSITVNSATICAGTSVTLTANGSTSYKWSPGSSTDKSITVSPNNTTSYTVTGTVSGSSSFAVSTVSVKQKPVISVNSSTICSGASATIIANGASGYLWSNGSASNSLKVLPEKTTSYTVIGNSSGCSANASATVTVLPSPIVSMSSTNTSPSACSGYLAANTTGIGPFTYAWSDAPSINSFERKNICNGSYTVTVTSSNCAASAIAYVGTNTPKPSLLANTVNVHSITFPASIGKSDGGAHLTIPDGNKNGCMPPYTYDFNGVKTVANTSPYAWDKTGLAEGFYTVNASDANGIKTSFVFVVSTPTKTFSTTPTTAPTSTLTATAVPSCTIKYNDIKSIKIQTAKAGIGLGNYIFTWKVSYKSTSANDVFDQDYKFTGTKGAVTVITNLFCTSRESGLAQGIDQFDLTTVGIESEDKFNTEIYPNPFNDKLFLTVEKTSFISISDLTGKEIYKTKINAGANTIEMDNLNMGIYFISIQNDHTSITKKIIKN